MKSALASYLLPCPVVFISTLFENQCDIMIGTAMFVSEKDPLLVVSLAKGHLTAELIDKAGCFTVIAASESQEELYEQLINAKAKGGDKFSSLSIATLSTSPSKPLIPQGSSAWFECKTVSKQEIEDYVIILARVTDHEDLGKEPIVWRNAGLFSLKDL